MQTWLALPDGKEEVDPAFEHVPADGLPLVEGEGVSARVLMGTLVGRRPRAPPAIRRPSMPILLLDAGASLAIDAEADERAIMVAEGEAELDGAARSSRSRFTSWRPAIARRSRPPARARAMLLGGGAFATPRHVYWNFVSSSKDRIKQAKEDWIERRFPLVPGDEEEFIPFPEVPKTVSYP